MARLVFRITFPFKTFTSSVSLLLPTCYWKIAPWKSAGKPFDAGPVCISHTLTHTYTKNTSHPPYPKQPIALAGICDPNPYFNFPSLMQTNSILVAFPHQRSAMWEMSLFSWCVCKKDQSETFLSGASVYINYVLAGLHTGRFLETASEATKSVLASRFILLQFLPSECIQTFRQQ